MTLQSSGAISLTDVLNELRIADPGRSGTISLGDADVLALAGRGLPISLGDLYGKSAFSVVGYGDSRSYGSQFGGGTAAAYPSVVIKGSGNYTINWTCTAYNPSLPNSSQTNTAGPTMSKGFTQNSNGFFDSFWTCTVTDNVAGKTISVQNIQAYADWNGNV